MRSHSVRRPEPMTGTNRRTVLALLGGGITASLAGCVGDADVADGVGLGSPDPDYEGGTADTDGEERTDEEQSVAEQFAEQEVDDGVTPRDDLVVADHEFVLEDGFEGSTVQGTVENGHDNHIETVEVRVRVYNDEGRRLGHYLASTVDLDAGSEWEFEVILLESPADVAEYDIAVLGTPS